MMQDDTAASIIFAAGYGSRVKGYSGNKTLLPLIPESGLFVGENLILHEIIRNLPKGPKALVVLYRKEDVIAATHDLEVSYCEQPVPNGTGGALVAAQAFLERIDQERLVITMGDVPFVKSVTYQNLIAQLGDRDLVVLGFTPRDKAQYGMLEIEKGTVQRITEWRYWKEYPLERQSRFNVFNAGIYAANRSVLLKYLDQLKQRPHRVKKKRNGRIMEIEEYFITDLVELFKDGGHEVGFTLAEEEHEVMGIDTTENLVLAQELYAKGVRQEKSF